MTGILTWGYVFVALEGFDKIAEIIEAAGIGDIRHTFVGRGQQEGSVFDTLIIQVVHGRAVGHFLEKTAEIFGRHTGGVGQLFQRDTVLVVCVNVFQYIFQLVNFLMVPDGLQRFLIIQVGGKYPAEELVKSAVYRQLVTAGFILESVKDPVGNTAYVRLLPAKMVIDHGTVVDDLLDIGLTGGVVL